MFIGCVGAYTFRVQVIGENFTRAIDMFIFSAGARLILIYTDK